MSATDPPRCRDACLHAKGEASTVLRKLLAGCEEGIATNVLASRDPWRPRGIEIRGRAEAVGGPRAVIRIHPERIVSWGLESDRIGERYSRSI